MLTEQKETSEDSVWIEVGPGQVLQGLVKKCLSPSTQTLSTHSVDDLKRILVDGKIKI